MGKEDPRKSRWAILIGVGINIDRTGQGTEHTAKDRSLKGAAQDVIVIHEFLRASSTTVDVASLTATKSADDDFSGRPIEAPELSPTYDNVISNLKRVIEHGKPGDCVYVHYSGHGTRRKDGAVALALFDPGELGTRYLYGTILRNALRNMTEKRMLVTLVLDCCFSGSVLRDHTQHIRFIEYDSRVDAQSEQIDPVMTGTDKVMRGSEIRLLRSLDSESYAIFCACSPDGEAREIELQGGARRGAFSYFLIDSLTILRKCGIRVGHQSLHHHIIARFRARCISQGPMLYGNNDVSFFSNLTTSQAMAFVSVYRNSEDGCLKLSAGQAHGVHEDDEYAVYAFDTPENAGDIVGQASVKVRVNSTACLESEVTPINPSEMELIELGSSRKARPLSSFSAQKVRVRLMNSLPNREEILKKALDQTFLSIVPEEDETLSFMLQVILNGQSVYEVQDAMSNKVPNLPNISLKTPGAEAAFTSILGHIATFMYFQQLDNKEPEPEFEASFSLDCERSPEEDGYLQVDHEKFLNFTFKNLDTRPKYLTVFDFKASWEVLNLVSAAREGGFLTVLPTNPAYRDDGTLKLPLQMISNQGSLQTEDVLKFFVTSQPTAFPAMVLPPISDHDFRKPEKLIELLRGLDVKRGNDHESWTTRTFLARTSSPELMCQNSNNNTDAWRNIDTA